jgi:hypothetical protein
MPVDEKSQGEKGWENSGVQKPHLLSNFHFVLLDDPSLTDEIWMERARTHFEGRVIVGKDLMEV